MDPTKEYCNYSKTELDDYLKNFNEYKSIDSEINTLEDQLRKIYILSKKINRYKFINYKNVHVTLKFEIKPGIMEYIEENKYGIRSYIYILFKDTFKDLNDIETIPINIILLKIYLYRKSLETNLSLHFKNINGFKGGNNIHELEQFLYFRIEKLLEKQITLLDTNNLN
jgi:hypothetical protein